MHANMNEVKDFTAQRWNVFDDKLNVLALLFKTKWPEGIFSIKNCKVFFPLKNAPFCLRLRANSQINESSQFFLCFRGNSLSHCGHMKAKRRHILCGTVKRRSLHRLTKFNFVLLLLLKMYALNSDMNSGQNDRPTDFYFCTCFLAHSNCS